MRLIRKLLWGLPALRQMAAIRLMVKKEIITLVADINLITYNTIAAAPNASFAEPGWATEMPHDITCIWASTGLSASCHSEDP